MGVLALDIAAAVKVLCRYAVETHVDLADTGEDSSRPVRRRGVRSAVRSAEEEVTTVDKGALSENV